jgi:hypothetical protein
MFIKMCAASRGGWLGAPVNRPCNLALALVERAWDWSKWSAVPSEQLDSSHTVGSEGSE